MSEKDRSGQASPGKPFALRPSVLSSSGPLDSSGQQSSKPSLLRPSALTAIADKIECSTSDVKKRRSENEDKNDDGVDHEQVVKKQKVENDAENKTGSLQLTGPIIPPKGIGTFGFFNAPEASQAATTSNEKVNDTKETYKYVFGESAKEEVTGFQDISNAEGRGKDDSNSEKVSEKELEQRLVDNANKHMSKENSSRLHLTEVEVVTGEEGERNVLQMQCKLHLFSHDKSSWIEKGRGILKLNDICKSEEYDIFQSRVVFRRQGSHQVVLNTLLWPEMCYDKGSSKSLRLTAMDAETEKINVYLVTGYPKDVTQLHTAIDRRVIALKRRRSESAVEADSASSSSNTPGENSCSSIPNDKLDAKTAAADKNVDNLALQNDSSSSTDSSENAS